MGTVADCFDNAMCESFFATLECELLARTRFDTHEQARRALFSFIEGWYNQHRLHSGIGYRSPMTYERMHAAQKQTSPACGLPTAGRRHGRNRRPTVRPWTTRNVTSNGGNSPGQNSTA
jgi:putative transposase